MTDLLADSVPIEEGSADLIPHDEAIKLFRSGTAIECATGDPHRCNIGVAFYYTGKEVLCRLDPDAPWKSYRHMDLEFTCNALLRWDNRAMWRVVLPPEGI
jgi:hypothetical protein